MAATGTICRRQRHGTKISRVQRPTGQFACAAVALPTPARLADVLDAIYVCYGVGWDGATSPGIEEHGTGLAAEAIYLARLMVGLMPGEPEAMGLLSLVLYCEARKASRRDSDGCFVPLGQQDAGRWNADMIIEAEGLLTAASRHARFGRFQCEAAIQSVHVQRPMTGRANYAALITLYTMLAEQTHSVGAIVALAAVYLEAGELPQAFEALGSVNAENVRSYQPFWVIRARILAALGDKTNANKALDIAMSLTKDPAVKDFLQTGGP